MLVEIEGKVYRRIKEKELHSCTGCIADSEYTDNRTSLCSAIQDTCGSFSCDSNPDTLEAGFIYEEVTGFNNTKELWEWLLAGNKVEYRNGIKNNTIVYMENGTVYLSNEYQLKAPYQLVYYSSYIPVSITTTEWYDDIPEQGIFCWVHDYHKDRKDNISLIKEYDSTRENKFINFRSEARIVSFYFATPLTQEELLERCYER